MMEGLIYGFVSIIGALFWLAKLEATSRRNTEVIRDVQSQLKEHLDRDDEVHHRVMIALTDIKEDVSEIKGFLKH